MTGELEAKLTKLRKALPTIKGEFLLIELKMLTGLLAEMDQLLAERRIAYKARKTAEAAADGLPGVSDGLTAGKPEA